MSQLMGAIQRSIRTTMPMTYARPLLDQEAIEDFLGKCLSINDPPQLPGVGHLSTTDIAKKIRDAESAVRQTNEEPTLTSKRNRVKKFRDDDARSELRKNILTELITLDRLDDDDHLKLGAGGAKPKGADPQPSYQAYIVVGLPASGKSTLISRISDELGAVILDSDHAKRKLPEFDNTVAGANLVHKEAGQIVFGGSDNPSLLGYCIANKFNVVIPKIGQDFEDIKRLRDALKHAGYKVHLTATILTRETATVRALCRFLKTGRYVPLGLIFDGYANDPLMNYYKERVSALSSSDWESFGAISTFATPISVDDCTSELNPAHLLRSAS